MKRTDVLILALLIFTFTLTAFAQDSKPKKPEYGWRNKAVSTLNFTQNRFDNWAKGGENAWSWQLNINGNFVYDQEKYNWTTSGKIAYGKTRVGDADAKKAADEVRLESVLTYKMGIYVNPYASVTGLSQFKEGYDYSTTPATTISAFMDPGYFTESIGVGIDITKQIKTKIGAAAKQTVTDKYSAIYANGETLRNELGASSVTDANIAISEKIIYTSKLELFSNFKGFDEIDVNWDNVFSAKVSDLINVSFNLKIFYDKDISPKRQLKETLAVGLSYTLL